MHKITAQSREPVRLGQLEVRYLVDGTHAGHMGSFELTVPPQSNVPPAHSHLANDEFLYVLEGTLRYTVGEVTRDLTPGEWMFTPRGVVHAFGNPHAATARALVTNSPDIGEQYFRDVAAVLGTGDPPDKGRLVQVMERYGLRLAPAPGG